MAEFLLTASAVARIREDAEVSVSRKPGYDEEMDEDTLEEPDLWGEPEDDESEDNESEGVEEDWEPEEDPDVW